MDPEQPTTPPVEEPLVSQPVATPDEVIQDLPPAQPQTMPSTPASSSRPPHFWVMVVGAVVLLLAVIFALVITLGKKKAPVDTSLTVATASPTATPSASPSASASTVALVQDAGVTWLNPPQVVSTDLALFQGITNKESTDSNGITSPGVNYYKVGTDHGKDIIIAVAPAIDPSGVAVGYFVATGTDTYDLLQKHSMNLYDDTGKYTWGNALATKVKVNAQKEYKSIASQKTLKVSSVNLTLSGSSRDNPFFKDPAATPTPTPAKAGEGQTDVKFADTPYGTMYNEQIVYATGTDEHPGKTAQQQYVLVRPDGTAAFYQLDPAFIKDDMVPQITWKDGTTNKDTYRFDGGGSCGSGSYIEVIADGSMTGLVQAGTTSANEPVYAFTDTNNQIVKDLYGFLTDGQYYDSVKNTMVPITIDQYLAKHGLFVYKDSLNRLVVFRNTVYGSGAECGKPVVYLYPTKTMPVSVQVDAKVNVSEPTYNNGWNVTAEPNGTLTTADGQKYDSLYWEGFGKKYPSVDVGFVAAQADLVPTLQSHLAALGLNQKEAQDFLNFWLPRLPKTPYVRLTWFGTKQMDELAPLSITPKPDTLIRVFLDFQGLDQPVPIAPERLSAIPRTGFTVVEWGGLLRH